MYNDIRDIYILAGKSFGILYTLCHRPPFVARRASDASPKFLKQC